MVLKDLKGFYGTEHYYKGFLNVLLTDGVQFIALNDCCGLITDICAVLKTQKNIKKESFVCIKFKVNRDNSAEVIYTDGNDNVLFNQKYVYTDFKKHFLESEVMFFYIKNVLMLNTEY